MNWTQTKVSPEKENRFCSERFGTGPPSSRPWLRKINGVFSRARTRVCLFIACVRKCAVRMRAQTPQVVLLLTTDVYVAEVVHAHRSGHSAKMHARVLSESVRGCSATHVTSEQTGPVTCQWRVFSGDKARSQTPPCFKPASLKMNPPVTFYWWVRTGCQVRIRRST